jgi:hypothetical protein
MAFILGVRYMNTMSKQASSTDRYVSIPVKAAMRDRLRVAKAREGQSYQAFLHDNLQLE